MVAVLTVIDEMQCVCGFSTEGVHHGLNPSLCWSLQLTRDSTEKSRIVVTRSRGRNLHNAACLQATEVDGPEA